MWKQLFHFPVPVQIEMQNASKNFLTGLKKTITVPSQSENASFR